jgi:hypothetical protein
MSRLLFAAVVVTGLTLGVGAQTQAGRPLPDRAMLFKATQEGFVQDRDLDAEALEKMRQLLSGNTAAQALVERLSAEFTPVLKLD